jgi:hypothetical protein
MTLERDHSAPVDMLKGLAIISVILLHSWNDSFLLQIGAPYYIGQAVPIFIIIAAYNGVNSYIRTNSITLIQCYSSIPRRMSRLLWLHLSFLIIEYLFILFIAFFKNDIFTTLVSITGKSPDRIQAVIATYSIPNLFSFIVTGGYGFGSFFVPVLIPLIFTLPILYLLSRKNVFLCCL